MYKIHAETVAPRIKASPLKKGRSLSDVLRDTVVVGLLLNIAPFALISLFT